MKSKFSKLIAFSLALVLLCAGVSFADSAFLDQPVASNLSSYYSYPLEGGIICGSYNGSDVYVVPHGNGQVAFGCYFFTYTVNNSTYLVGATSDSIIQPSGFYAYNSSSGLLFSTQFNLEVDSETGLTYVSTNNIHGVTLLNTHIPVFSSLSEGLDAVHSAVNNVTVSETFDFTLTPGYALVIDGECEVSERTYNLSGSSSLNIFQNKNGSVQWYGATGNIRDGFSPDQNNPSYITWEPLNSNSAGNASSYSYYANDVVSVSSGASFVITNPLNYGTIYVSTGARAVIENVNMTGSIYIQYSGERPSIRYVALDSHMQGDGLLTFYNTFSPSVLNQNVSFTDGSGDSVVIDPSDAPIGGGDAGSPSIDEDNSFLAVIQRLLNQIKGLFSSAVQGITELVNEGSSFMRSIGQVFSWLPEPLVALLISGFTVLLVVGVLKVLWR